MITTSDAPPEARTAVILLWLSVLITLVQTGVEDFLSDSATTTAVAFVLAIYGLVIFRASRRRNWARYALLIWTVLAVVIYSLNFQNDLRPLWGHMLVVASFAAEFIAIRMLFTGVVGLWYREKVVA
jgi:membrane-associated HD superfamily phosphohydrolase